MRHADAREEGNEGGDFRRVGVVGQRQGEDGGQTLGEPAAGLGNVVDARGVLADVSLGEDRPVATPTKMRIVATLIIANQNSASPKAFTLIMLRTNTRPRRARGARLLRPVV